MWERPLSPAWLDSARIWRFGVAYRKTRKARRIGLSQVSAEAFHRNWSACYHVGNPVCLSFLSREEGFPAYDADALRESLSKLKERSAKTDPGTLGDLADMLAESGVVLQFVEAPKKFPLHGITRWTSNGNPVIQMTGRRKTDGFIIWTLYHELGHILNDCNVGMTVDYTDERLTANHDAEKLANAFAKDVLLGSEGLSPYHGLSDSASIRNAAQARGVCPGVVVNLMHRNRMLSYKWCNDLLVDMVVPFSA
ncbi:hypothetical protein [Paratractidigestivibacter sp.]|uniref:ImmA/IrrE family metallo-endopeptidase n=1 Tax=Paratractidigestivibacter sp. TaxID=2847316 RepID=UPI002AC94785|nr:hypothetical protein [Paratractidigestivibacter sp.]